MKQNNKEIDKYGSLTSGNFIYGQKYQHAATKRNSKNKQTNKKQIRNHFGRKS